MSPCFLPSRVRPRLPRDCSWFASSIEYNEMEMRRRLFLQAMAAASTAFAADSQVVIVRGKLSVREGRPSSVTTPENQSIELDGDEPTQKVLSDRRLNGYEIEAKGKFS